MLPRTGNDLFIRNIFLSNPSIRCKHNPILQNSNLSVSFLELYHPIYKIQLSGTYHYSFVCYLEHNALSYRHSVHYIAPGKSKYFFLRSLQFVFPQVALFAFLKTNTILLLQYEHSSLLQIWRLFTYAFVEVDPRNLILNLPAQLLLGFLLENFHMWWKVVILYLGGGLMAALGSSFLNNTIALMGSSPGVFSFGFSCLADTQIVSK